MSGEVIREMQLGPSVADEYPAGCSERLLSYGLAYPRTCRVHGLGPCVPLRQREGDQPPPVPNDLPDVQSMVMADLTARRELGISRYGTALQAHNGRDMLRDAYEEALDLAVYLRGAIEERDHPKENGRVAP